MSADTDTPEGRGTLVPADLLEILCCPFEECRQPFEELVDERKLLCRGCGRRYAVDEHGTPDLLREDAEPPPQS